jgi:hypothetical protein
LEEVPSVMVVASKAHDEKEDGIQGNVPKLE